MNPKKCPECGARLPAQAGPHVCVYCQHEVVIVDDRAAPPPPPPRPQVVLVTSSSPAAGAGRAVGLIGGLVTLAVLGIVGATLWPVLRTVAGVSSAFNAVPGLSASIAAWDGKSALECSGNQQLTVEDKHVELSGTAVIAGGNCRLKLVRCTVAADVAIEAGGNAHVLVDGGAIQGRRLAVDAGGNAVVEVRGGLKGKVKRSGNARVNQ